MPVLMRALKEDRAGRRRSARFIRLNTSLTDSLSVASTYACCLSICSHAYSAFTDHDRLQEAQDHQISQA